MNYCKVIILCILFVFINLGFGSNDFSGVIPEYNGTKNITMKLYTSETSESAVWTETHNGVIVTNGNYTTDLGAINPLIEIDSGTNYYIEIYADGELIGSRRRIDFSGSSARILSDDAPGDGGVILEEMTPSLEIGNGTDDVIVVDGSDLGIGLATGADATGRLEVRGDEVRVWDGTASVDYATGEGDLFIEDDAEVDGFLFSAAYRDNTGGDLINIASGAPLTATEDADGSWTLDLGSLDDNDWTGAGTGTMSPSTSTDNIGLGTTSATGKLDIRGDEVRVWDGTATVGYATGAGDVFVEDALEVDGTIYGSAYKANAGGDLLAAETGSPLSVTEEADGSYTIGLGGGTTTTTETYLIPLSGFTGWTSSSGYSHWNGGSPNCVLTWTSTGSGTVTSAVIDINIGVDCHTTGQTRTTSFNGSASGTFTSLYWCDSSVRTRVETITLNPADYNVGGSNNVAVTNATTSFGFCHNTTWGTDIYARVTVTYSTSGGLDDNDWTGAGSGTMTATNTTDNIGIGTSTVTGKLDVRGDEVRVWDGTASVGYATGAGDLFVEDAIEVDGTIYGSAYRDNVGGDLINIATGAPLTATEDADGSWTLDLTGGLDDNDWTGAGTGTLSPTTTTDNIGLGTTAATGKLDVRGDEVRVWDGSASVGYATGAGDMFVEDALEVDGTIYGSAYRDNAGGDLLNEGSGITITEESDGSWTIDAGGGSGTPTTEVYLIPLSGFTGWTSSSGGSNYDCGSAYATLTWTSTGSGTVTSAVIDMNIGVDCHSTGETRTTSFNGSASGTFTSLYHCSTALRTQVESITLDPSDYNVGGSNSISVTNKTTCFGFCTNSTWGSGIYARVTVTYNSGSGGGADTDWTGAGTGTMTATNTTDNIGIGTSSVTGKLDVRGDEVRVWDGTATVGYATGAGDVYVEDALEVDGSIYSSHYRDNAGGNLINAGTGATVTADADGSYTVSVSSLELDDLSDVNLTSPSEGDMIYNDGTDWVNLGIGTSGQVLTSDGSVPVWADPTGGSSGTLTCVNPWGENVYGSISGPNGWNYTMGFDFTPSVDGTVTKVGGYFSGTKTVSLWNDGTGALLATASVTGTGSSFTYTTLGSPVSLTAGTRYTVAVYLAGNGGYYASSVSFPDTYGDITINASVYSSGNTRPISSEVTSNMYGMADIEFCTGSGGSSDRTFYTTHGPIGGMENNNYTYYYRIYYGNANEGPPYIYSYSSESDDYVLNIPTPEIPEGSSISLDEIEFKFYNAGSAYSYYGVYIDDVNWESSSSAPSRYQAVNTNWYGSGYMTRNHTIGYDMDPDKVLRVTWDSNNSGTNYRFYGVRCLWTIEGDGGSVTTPVVGCASPPYGTVDLGTLTPTSSHQNAAYTAGTRAFWHWAGTAGTHYNFSLCSNTEDSYLRIYNSSCSMIASNDDSGPHCSGGPSSINWTCPTTGNYTVEITHYSTGNLYNSNSMEYWTSTTFAREAEGGVDESSVISEVGTSSLVDGRCHIDFTDEFIAQIDGHEPTIFLSPPDDETWLIVEGTSGTGFDVIGSESEITEFEWTAKIDMSIFATPETPDLKLIEMKDVFYSDPKSKSFDKWEQEFQNAGYDFFITPDQYETSLENNDNSKTQ